MTIGFPSSLFAKTDGPPVPPAPTGPINPASLFGAGERGAYYNFTDGTTLAVNADGTGGTPAIGAACSSALDLSPNGHRLRNTVGSVTRRANGIETSGTSYGLFNMTGYGDWPNIPMPFEIVACVEQLAFSGADARLLSAYGNGVYYLQGTTSGRVRPFAAVYGTEVNPGLSTEFVLDTYFDGGASTLSLDGAPMLASPMNSGQALDGLVLGSHSSGTAATQGRFKHLLVIGRALTTAERAGVLKWMQA